MNESHSLGLRIHWRFANATATIVCEMVEQVVSSVCGVATAAAYNLSMNPIVIRGAKNAAIDLA